MANRTLKPCGTRAAYSRGCRCEECRRAHREMQAAWRQKQQQRDGVSYRVLTRKTPDVFCGECGGLLRFGGGGAPAGVDPRCVKCSRKRAYIPRSVRVAVYERDNYVCQLCREPTDPDSDSQGPWYPTLDHIVPVSMGGTDDPHMLRTAHRWCNGVRGVSDPHGLFEEAS